MRNRTAAHKRRKLVDVTERLDQLVDAIAGGLQGGAAQGKLDELERHKSELETVLAKADVAAPRLHPNLAEIYRSQVARLHEALAREDTRTEAIELLRGLIDRVVLHPGGRGPGIELVGEIASMVALTLPRNDTAAQERAAVSEVFRRSMKVVAGRGFEPLTFRL